MRVSLPTPFEIKQARSLGGSTATFTVGLAAEASLPRLIKIAWSPAESAAREQVNCWGLTILIDVHGLLPTNTVTEESKPVPLIVIVPPAIGTWAGEMVLTERLCGKVGSVTVPEEPFDCSTDFGLRSLVQATVNNKDTIVSNDFLFNIFGYPIFPDISS